MIPGNADGKKENPTPGTIPTNTFTVVWLLQSEYSILCRVSEDSTANINSTQSIIHLTLGNFSFIECGSFCLTASDDGQTQIEPNFTYIKLIRVINIFVTVPSETLNK